MVPVLCCVLVNFQAHLLRESDIVAIDSRSAAGVVADAGGNVIPLVNTHVLGQLYDFTLVP